ncbi:response regulator [Paracoccus caeni]|uniref:histidine kinase n=1 Tax=Paracoccus caeni TaxID=657651 RepID=A0A934SIP5_9RHOB|nr:ATP-binding protein [Paracoccus caeni]MBK4218214.1 response regulator [Paracoccus caeni]
MLRDSDDCDRRVEKLAKINTALMHRLERIEETRGPAYALTRTAAVLEREVVERNRDLEAALSDLAATNTELVKAREVADQANRAKSRFLRAASHDLLQPLSAAKLLLSHLRDLASNELQRDLGSHLMATIDSAEELIHALSNIARLDSNSLQMNPAPVAMSRLFRRLIIDMHPLATSRHIDLRFASTAATVESDPVYLRQIAQNLIANALKYTTGRKVLVGVRREGAHIWLEVLDQGPGIAPNDHARIFREFERLSQTDRPGTGLGLSIVQRACEQLGHRLELHSEPGRGSRFRVRLPAIPTSAPIPALPSVHEDFSLWAIELEGLRIMVIENDPAMRKVLGYTLNSWGMKVVTVSDIAAARRAASKARPDVILTDYRLEAGETGIHALEALKLDLGAEVPAVILSAEAADTIRAEASGHLPLILRKPVAEIELCRAIHSVLGSKPT